ncbi:XRE family transcriptional regulator [Tetragenococcus koreensis]|uniref:XRE family transcriptional regulator n=1 Tax=Tetragenococcus koreensis TaxID=290335 RepID=UPI000F4EACC1|nr:XRE family transcriptional regulator [Tetragenococcus koreensis]AYW46748.1 phage repressor protein [Tetragenococcus koreensis]GEN89966.1 hypothetical protein TKO01_00120 [Tetragenococcus koreensis]
MVDTNKLKGIIVERGTTQQNVAESIGINRSTFYRKMKNGGDFSIGEAQKIAENVPLTNEEAVEIFFSDKVAFTLQRKKQEV